MTKLLFVSLVVLEKFDVKALLEFSSTGYDVEFEPLTGTEYVNVYLRTELAAIDEGWAEGDGPWHIADYPIMQTLLQQIDSIGGRDCSVAERVFKNPKPADWRYRPEI